jgi:hypothetical protein
MGDYRRRRLYDAILMEGIAVMRRKESRVIR